MAKSRKKRPSGEQQQQPKGKRKRTPGKGRGRRGKEKKMEEKKIQKGEDEVRTRTPAKVKDGAFEKAQQSAEALREADYEAEKSFEGYAGRVLDLRDVITVTPPTEGGGKYAGLYVLQLSPDSRMTKKDSPNRSGVTSIPLTTPFESNRPWGKPLDGHLIVVGLAFLDNKKTSIDIDNGRMWIEA